jgi:DNA polymerase III epsilon subunit-like protein
MSYKKNKILIFDVETNGLLPKLDSSGNALGDNPYILQFSFILFDTISNSIERKHNFYIKVSDDVLISDEITKLNGITREICNTKGVSIITAIECFYDCYMLCDRLIAHNYDFDSRMIKIEMGRNMNIIKEKVPYCANLLNNIYESLHGIENFCTMRVGTNICNIIVVKKEGDKPRKKWPTLLELYKHYFNEVPDNLHNSMVDVLVCLRCYLKMNKNYEISNQEFQNMILESV